MSEALAGGSVLGPAGGGGAGGVQLGPGLMMLAPGVQLRTQTEEQFRDEVVQVRWAQAVQVAPHLFRQYSFGRVRLGSSEMRWCT